MSVGELADRGWPTTPLGQYLEEPPHYGINAPAVPFDGLLPQYIRITDITAEGQFDPDPPVAVNHPDSEAYLLRSGDVVVARTGASVGKSYLFQGDGTLVYAGFLIRLRVDPRKLDPRYLAAFMQSHRYWAWIKRSSMRSGQPGINARQISEMPLPVPPLKEQEAIADVLSDVEELVKSLDELIEKKRDVRTASQQALLLGTVRLPGFDDDWVTVKTGQLGTFLKGRGISKRHLVDDGVPCILYGEIYTRHHDWIRDFASFIPQSHAKYATRLVAGDLLFTGSGETVDEVGKCVAYLGGQEAYAGGDIVILRGAESDPLFLGYAMNAPAVVHQKIRLAQGATVAHLTSTHLSQIEVLLPDRQEQQAIARVLANMDAEIEALVAQREKTALLKQGMMQELLTGRTRLV